MMDVGTRLPMANSKDFSPTQWFSLGLMMGELMRVLNFTGPVIDNYDLRKKINDLAAYSYALSHEAQDERQK